MAKMETKAIEKSPVIVKVQDAKAEETIKPSDDSWKILLLLGGAVVIFIVLGIVILRGSLTAQGAYSNSYESKTAMVDSYGNSYYPAGRAYDPRPTDFNWVLAFGFIAGLGYLLRLGYLFTKDRKQDLEIALALLGSAMFVSGILALFGATTFMQNYEAQGILDTVKYAWLIEGTIFGAVGLAILWFAAQIDKQTDFVDRLPIDLAAPVVLIYFSILFGFAVHDVISRSDTVGLSFLERFGAVISAMFFGAIAFIILKFQKEGSPELVFENKWLFKAFGYIYLVPAFFVFVLGLMNLLQSSVDMQGILKWLGESFVYIGIGAGYLYYSDKLSKESSEDAIKKAA